MTKLRQLWLLTALAAVAVLAGGYFLLVSPKSGEATTLRGEAASQQVTNQGVRAHIDQLNKQKKDLPAKQALLAEFASKIPSNPSMPAFIRLVSDAADKSGVELISVTPGTPLFTKAAGGANLTGPGNTVLATIPVALGVEGHFANITQFFAELESLPRAMLVGGMDLERIKNSVIADTGTDANGAPIPQAVDDGKLVQAKITTSVLMTTKAPAPVAAPVAPPADATK
jgi:Tfp pilus assembly protein PilO